MIGFVESVAMGYVASAQILEEITVTVSRASRTLAVADVKKSHASTTIYLAFLLIVALLYCPTIGQKNSSGFPAMPAIESRPTVADRGEDSFRSWTAGERRSLSG